MVLDSISLMKHLKGYGKRYFSLAIIAMYSTLNKLSSIDSNFQYHKKAFAYQEYKTSPPYSNFNY
ncbi:hypothetical protein ALC152_21620 [Arcobacter sp. 15-2]